MTTNTEEYDFARPPVTPEEQFAYEKFEATDLLRISGNHPDTLMYLLELAWMRGHHAAQTLDLPETANPYKLQSRS